MDFHCSSLHILLAFGDQTLPRDGDLSDSSLFFLPPRFGMYHISRIRCCDDVNLMVHANLIVITSKLHACARMRMDRERLKAFFLTKSCNRNIRSSTMTKKRPKKAATEGMVKETWAWGTGGLRPASEPTTGHLVSWAGTWPPSWWPMPLLHCRHGSVKESFKRLHGKSFSSKEAVHINSRAKILRLDLASGPNAAADRCLTAAIPRPSRHAGIGVDSGSQGRQLLLGKKPLLKENDFPQPSTDAITYMSLLNWNAGLLNRNTALIDSICGNWMLVLLQESSTTLGQELAASRGICWSDAPDGRQGSLAVLAGASGAKLVSPTYGLNFNGQILRPHKKDWKQGDRLLAACFYTVDVTWQNKNGESVKRAGLESWRVTTFHMDHDEAKSGGGGSGGKTLAAAFGLAMRDQHRVFAGDFNQAHRYIVSILDDLIANKPEYAGISYKYLQGFHSPEIGTVIFNYPGTVQLTGEEKTVSFEEKSRFWQCLNLKTTDNDAHFPQVLQIYEKDVVGDLKRRKLTHRRSEAGKKKQTRKKRERQCLQKQAPEAQSSEFLDGD